MSTETPIEDYLDQLLRHVHADPRTTRRLIDEAHDHLLSATAELEASGLSRLEAERQAVANLGPVDELARGCWRRSFLALVSETLRAAVLLGACGLVAIGLSGGLAAIMNGLAGPRFVGATTVFDTGGSSIGETAHDAVILRVLAGLVGVAVLVGYRLVWRSANRRVLPAGLVDALGAAAFAAATVVLVAASIDQAVTGSGAGGVGFFLSGAVASLAGAVLFCARATRALLPAAS